MRIDFRTIRVLGVAVVTAAGLAGIIYAQSSDPVINGCYKTQNGQLRVVAAGTQCLPSETAISWNQVGPQGLTGPQGPQGATGAQGPTGPRGPSDAYDGFRFPGNNIAVTSTDPNNPTIVLQYNIPAGAFAITSKVNVSAGSSLGGLVHCVTRTASDWFDMGVASIGPGPGQTLEATESTTFSAQEPAAGQLTIYCWRINASGPAPIAGLAEAVAIQVGAAHVFGF